MNDSNTLRTQYVDILKEQKNDLNSILNSNGSDSSINDSFESMIDKVLEIKGKEVLPYYNFSNCESPELQAKLKDINFANQTSLGGCFAYWQTPDLSSVNTINAKIMDRFVYGDNNETIFKVTLGKFFRLDNCTSLKYFLAGGTNDTSGRKNPLDLIHDDVPKQTINNPINMDYLLTCVSFNSDTTGERLKKVVEFFKKVKFTNITSLNSFMATMKFPTGKEDIYSELLSELVDEINFKNVESMSYFMSNTNFQQGLIKLKPNKKQVFEKIKILDHWFSSYTRIGCVDLSNWEFKQVTEIDSWDTNSSGGGEYLEYVHMGYNSNPTLVKLSDCWAGASRLHTLDFSGWNFGGFNYFYRNWYNAPKKLVNIYWGYDHGKGYTQEKANNEGYTFNFGGMESLSKESVIDLFNKLYDLNLTYNVANGGTLYTQKIELHSNVKAQLTPEDIAIATNKGWTIV